MSKLDYLSEPIIPGRAIGGISLGASRSEVDDKLPTPVRRKRPDPDSEWLLYRGLAVYLVDDEVTDLGAGFFYRGTTPEGIRVGLPWEELKDHYPDLWFEEEVAYGWISPSLPGISFSIGKVVLTDWKIDKVCYQVDDFAYEVKEPRCSEITSIGIFSRPDEPSPWQKADVGPKGSEHDPG